MKTYFTKYLPVEEKLQPGDRYMEGTFVSSILDRNYIKELETMGKLHGKKKARLTLCTRNLKVGDKFSCFIGKNLGTGVIAGDYDTKWNVAGSFPGVYVSKADSFKVIGAISNDALWVKEGDEFDEDDWELLVRSSIIEAKRKDHPDFIRLLKTEGTYIKLRCPTCKLFH